MIDYRETIKLKILKFSKLWDTTVSCFTFSYKDLQLGLWLPQSDAHFPVADILDFCLYHPKRKSHAYCQNRTYNKVDIG